MKIRSAGTWSSFMATAAMLSGFLLAGCATQESASARAADNSVLNYERAKRNGLQQEQCQYAKVAMRLFLQANDDESMKKWKGISENDCKAAGVPTARPRLGVNIAAMPAEIQQRLLSNKGLYVASVEPDSPAFRANILAGDVIIMLNGVEVNTMSAVPAQVADACKKGADIPVTVMRGDRQKTELKVAACS